LTKLPSTHLGETGPFHFNNNKNIFYQRFYS